MCVLLRMTAMKVRRLHHRDDRALAHVRDEREWIGAARMEMTPRRPGVLPQVDTMIGIGPTYIPLHCT